MKRKDSIPTPEGTSGTGDAEVMDEIWAAIYELRCHNWMLEDDVQNIRQHQHEIDPREETELLDS